jgi:hypothetical protein
LCRYHVQFIAYSARKKVRLKRTFSFLYHATLALARTGLPLALPAIQIPTTGSGSRAYDGAFFATGHAAYNRTGAGTYQGAFRLLAQSLPARLRITIHCGTQ